MVALSLCLAVPASADLKLVDDLELADGHVQVKGSPGAQIDLGAVAVLSNPLRYAFDEAAARATQFASPADPDKPPVADDEEPGLEGTDYYSPPRSTFANGTHAAVIEVDVETGAVTLIRWVVAHDCGRVLNPTLVDGQIHGGVVQGLPDALNEQLAHDETGQRLTATLMEYTLATACDAPPRFEIHHLESPSPLNPLGAKGAGEGGIMPVHPVLAQAIEDALRPFGIQISRVPISRAEIHALVERARLNTGSGPRAPR